MKPEDTGKNYDQIAAWWLSEMENSSYGMAALERALSFVSSTRFALDVGCGCEGRFIRRLTEEGFCCTGLDVSAEMIKLAAARFPAAEFFTGDICSWEFPRKYNLITAWDSIFHLPLGSHREVIKKLCAGLAPGGVLLFTCGGGEGEGEVHGEFGGQQFEYSTIGVPAFVQLLSDSGCPAVHVEYDQKPESHVYIVAKRD